MLHLLKGSLTFSLLLQKNSLPPSVEKPKEKVRPSDEFKLIIKESYYEDNIVGDIVFRKASFR